MLFFQKIEYNICEQCLSTKVLSNCMYLSNFSSHLEGLNEPRARTIPGFAQVLSPSLHWQTCYEESRSDPIKTRPTWDNGEGGKIIRSKVCIRAKWQVGKSVQCLLRHGFR